MPARRSGPKAKQVSWTRSQNQSTNTQKHTKTNNMSMSMINHLQNKLKRVWLPACLCPAVGSILRTCDKPLCRESRQYTKRDFLRKYLQPVSTGTRQSNRWRELLRGPSFITFQLWPLAPIRRPEDATSTSPKQFHYTSCIVSYVSLSFSEQTCTNRCEDGLPWIMLIWRLMWEKKSTSDIMIYVIIICAEGSVFATRL